MNENATWIWIRVTKRMIDRAITLLKLASMRGHADARRMPERAEELREQADADDADAEAFKEAERHGVERRK